MTRTHTLRFTSLAVALAASPLVVPSAADACGRAIELALEPVPQLLAEAEAALARDEPVDAHEIVARTAHRDLSGSQIGWRSRVLSAASIRSGGYTPASIEGGFGSEEKQQQRNVQTAVATLERMLKDEEHKDDPQLLGLYGEGLAQLPGREQKAREVLGKLAEDDLLPSAQAWGAYGRLLEAAGRADDAKLALSTCQAMAGDRPERCALPNRASVM